MINYVLMFGLSNDFTETTVLQSEDFDEIYSKLESCASHWMDIGLKLGFTKAEMDSIQQNPMLMTPERCMKQMLRQWLLWAPGDGRGSKDFAKRESLHLALVQANQLALAKQFQ